MGYLKNIICYTLGQKDKIPITILREHLHGLSEDKRVSIDYLMIFFNIF